jgi:ATP-dependent RNA helicase SUPV3L1/SUV3
VNQQTDRLADFAALKSSLKDEAILLSKEYEIPEENFLRRGEKAELCLDLVARVQTDFAEFFKSYPYLENIFENEFMPLEDFFDKEFVVDTVFFESFIVPDKSFLALPVNLEESQELMSELERWKKSVLLEHESCQQYLKENLQLTTEFHNLTCKCHQCYADFRSFLRREIINIVKTQLQTSFEEMSLKLGQGVTDLSEHFRFTQKQIEKSLNTVRSKFKKSSFQKIESQAKQMVEDKFHYPSEVASAYATVLKNTWKAELREVGISEEIVNEAEYDRFLRSLGSKIYRPEKQLAKDFKKFVNSLMFLKRKDISGEILTEYLGAFWAYSHARKIKRKIIYHMGPTNSGKTYHAIQALCKSKSGSYLAPLRLLAAELYDTMNKNGAVTSLLTGEEVIDVEGATHYSSTIEMAKLSHQFECCVIDEIQMISDRQRGWAWTRALVGMHAKEVHVCGDHSAHELVKQIVDLCGDELEVKKYERMTELQVARHPIKLRDLQRSDALIVFSRRNALRHKYELEKLGFKVSIIYGMLSPEVRREQARKFDQEITDIMVSTDAIAMGMNLPIKRIVFSTLKKFVNSEEFEISDSEIKQISGRAGRFKRFPVGTVTCLDREPGDLERIKDAIGFTLEQNTQCMVGPDVEIFNQVNAALTKHGLHELKLSEFLNIFNAMIFKKPFYCVELREMIELAEMVEDLDVEQKLSKADVFGFACAPVNLGLLDHVQFFAHIVGKYVTNMPIQSKPIDFYSDDIDYLETSIKCVELYQWLSRHFHGPLFDFDKTELLENKMKAVEKLNDLLGDKIVPKQSYFDHHDSRRDKKGGKRFDRGRRGAGRSKQGTDSRDNRGARDNWRDRSAPRERDSSGERSKEKPRDNNDKASKFKAPKPHFKNGKFVNKKKFDGGKPKQR